MSESKNDETNTDNLEGNPKLSWAEESDNLQE